MGGLQLHIANQQAQLGRYDFNIWEAMQKFKDLLSQDVRQEFFPLIKEGKR